MQQEEMYNTLIMAYGLSNEEFETLMNEFENVEDVTDNFNDLITRPAAGVIVDWDKLNDEEKKTFIDAFKENNRELNTEICILGIYDDENVLPGKINIWHSYSQDIPMLHVLEFGPNSLDNTIYMIKKRLSVPKRFDEAKKRIENTVEDIKKVIEEPAKGHCFEDQISLINNGCKPYEFLTKIMNHFPELKTGEKVPYRIEVNSVFTATLIAFGLLRIEDVNFDSLSLSGGDDDKESAKDYINYLTNTIKNHYEGNLRKNHAIKE